MVSVSYIYCRLKNRSFTLRLFESHGKLNLGQICQNLEAKFESQLNVIDPCSVL